MKAQLVIAVAALLTGGALHAQERFAPRLDRNPIPAGRAPDRTADSPEKVDFSVDFSATQTPLAPGKVAAPSRQARQPASVDRPVDAPVQARWPSPPQH